MAEDFRSGKEQWIYYADLDEYGYGSLKRNIQERFESIKSEDILNDVQDYNAIGSYLINLGKKERENEIKILQEYFQTKENVSHLTNLKPYEYVKIVNEVTAFNNNFNRLVSILDKDNGNEFENEYNLKLLEDEINKITNKVFDVAYKQFQNKLIVAIRNGDEKRFEVVFSEFLEKISDLILNDSSFDEEIFGTTEDKKSESDLLLDKIFETREQFRRTYGIILKNNYLSNIDFKNILEKTRERLGFKKKNNKRSRSNKKKYGTSIKNNIFDFKNLNNIASGIAEQLAMTFNKMSLKNDFISIDTITEKISTAMFSADSFQIVSNKGDVSLSLDDIIPENSIKNKEGARNYLYQLEQAAKAKNKKQLFIYTSTKLYSKETIKKGFHGTEYSYGSAITLLQDLNYKNPELLFWKLLNTMEKAVLENSGEKIKKDLKLAIIKNIASFMFDDAWNFTEAEIASQTNLDVLHLFNLNNIILPLSSLLLGLGNAFKKTNDENYTDWATVSISYPKKVAFGPEEYNGLKKWKEQRQIAQNNFSIRAKILRNFTDEITKFLKIEQ